MNIQFENADKVNGLMTITIEKDDYQAAVEKKLKDYRKKANVPGFRPGMVPMGLIKRQFGTAIKADEVNRVLSDGLFDYIRKNNIQMLGEPMPNEEKQQPQDLAGDGPFVFVFDIAVAPEFQVELTGDDTIDYYDIQVDDKMIDEQVRMFQSQAGEFVDAQEWSGNDTLIGDLRQLDADGNTLEGGITTQGASVMPSYVKGEDERKKFDGAKPGDIIIFNPKKAYPDNDAEVAAMMKVDKEQVKDVESDFSFQVTSIRHFQPHALDQELFDRVFGEGNVSSEADFRQKIAEAIKPQLTSNGDFRFLQDVRTYLEQKVGELQMPEELLKRFMKHKNEEKGESYVEEHFEGSMKELKWHLIKEQLVKANNIKVDDDDVKQLVRGAVRQQFAQYGMNNVPDDVIDNYADEQLKKGENMEGYVDRAVDIKLMQALKQVVKLRVKEVTLDEFNKLVEQA